MKRARVLGLALTAIGVSQIALTLAPGEPRGELLLVFNALFTIFAGAMAWRPEWADGKRSNGYLQQQASGPWLLLGGGCMVLGLAALAIALGSTLSA